MKKIMVAAAIMAIFAGCYNDKYDKLYPVLPATTCDTTTITYSHDIAPIMAASCAINGGCHNAAGNANTVDLDFTVFSVLQGQATADLMLNDINGTPTTRHAAMPLNLPKLAQCDINKITRWVNQGALNN